MATVQKSQLWAVDFPGMGVQTPGVDDMSALPCGGAQGALGGTEEWGGGVKHPELNRAEQVQEAEVTFPTPGPPPAPFLMQTCLGSRGWRLSP